MEQLSTAENMIVNQKTNKLDFNTYINAAKLYHAKNYRFKIRIFLICFLASQTVALLMFYKTYQHTHEYQVNSHFTFFLIPIIISALATLLSKPFNKKILYDLASSPFYQKDLLLKFDNEKFVFYTESLDYVQTIKYADIYFLKQNNELILIGVSNFYYIIIPSVWFDNETVKNQFLQYCPNA